MSPDGDRIDAARLMYARAMGADIADGDGHWWLVSDVLVADGDDYALPRRDMEHLAGMTPAVGIAVARLLQAIDNDHDLSPAITEAADRLARRYLGLADEDREGVTP